MKNLLLLLVVTFASQNSLAKPQCKAVIFQDAEWDAGLIEHAISENQLLSRGIKVVPETDPVTHDYYLSVEVSRDQGGLKFATLSIMSLKLLDGMFGKSPPKKCEHGQNGPDFFSTTVLLNQNHAQAASALIRGLLSCELLQKIEQRAISELCEK